MDNRIERLNSNSIEEPSNKAKLLNLVNKKNLKIFLLVVLAILILVILFGFEKKEGDDQIDSVYKSNHYKTTLEYCAELESKLQSVISKIDGAGQVSVMVSVDGSPELIYANESDETISSNSSGTTSSSNSSSPIIVNVGGESSALILTEKLPEVKGVIVVSSGAGNVAVKLNILQAVSTLLNLHTDKVSVLKGI